MHSPWRWGDSIPVQTWTVAQDFSHSPQRQVVSCWLMSDGTGKALGAIKTVQFLPLCMHLKMG